MSGYGVDFVHDEYIIATPPHGMRWQLPIMDVTRGRPGEKPAYGAPTSNASLFGLLEG